jgi:hypothetical protein
MREPLQKTADVDAIVTSDSEDGEKARKEPVEKMKTQALGPGSIPLLSS